MESILQNNPSINTVTDGDQNQYKNVPSSLQPFTPLTPKRAKVSFASQIKIDDSFLQQCASQKEINGNTPNAFAHHAHSMSGMFESNMSQQTKSKAVNPQKLGSVSKFGRNLTMSDQFITGISQRYIERIKLLQKVNKTYRDQIGDIAQKSQRLQSENNKLKRQMVFVRQKLELLQNEKSMLQYKIKQFQNVKRQLQLIKFNKNQEVLNTITKNQTLKKKLQNRQKKYKELLDSMHQSCIKAEKQKQKIQFEYSKLKSKCQQLKQQYQGGTREQEKQYNHQRQIYQRQISKLQAQLKQKIQRQGILESGQKQLKKSIELQKNNDQKMKEEIAFLNYELGNLKQSLSLTQNSLYITKQQMKSLSLQNEQIKKLVAKMNEKDELIHILRNKIIDLQDMVGYFQMKIKEQDQNSQNMQVQRKQLEQEKKELEQVINEQKQSIQKLVAQLEGLQAILSNLTSSLQQKVDAIEHQKEEYQKRMRQILRNEDQLQSHLKQVSNQLAEEQQKNAILQNYSKILKNRNEQLLQALQKANGEKMHLSDNLIQLANESLIHNYKATSLQSKLQELKEIQVMKESVYSQQLQNLAKKEMEKEQQLQFLKEEIQCCKLKMKSMDQQKRHIHNEYINKQRELQQLYYQLFQLRNQKQKLQHKLQMVQSQCQDSHLKVNQYHEEIEQLKKYIQELQIHINELDNILVWDFEGGEGQNNNFQQRKIKMENLVTVLKYKTGEADILKAQKLQQALIIEQKNKKIQGFTVVISAFTQKIENFLKEKDDLTKMIEEIEINNKKLADKLGVLKQKELDWMSKQRTLGREIKFKQDQIMALNQEKNTLIAKSETMQSRLKDRQAKNQQLTLKYGNQKQKSNSFKQMIEKLTLERRRIQDDSNRKIKDLSKQLETLKKDSEDKSKNFSLLDQQKKQQVNSLNNYLNSLKTQIKEFAFFYEGEKFNFTKRNALLMELVSILSKLQKSIGAKSSLFPTMKDILKKMQQFDNNSSKLFARYDKFQNKKET